MTTLARLLQDVEDASPGPATLALFDLDGTLVDGYTAGAFYKRRIRRGEVGAAELAKCMAVWADSALLGGDPGRLVPVAVAGLKGKRMADLQQLAQDVYATELAQRIRPEVRALLEAHQAHGHTTAIASSATPLQVAPVAAALGVDHVRCSELAVRDGVLTGVFDGEGMVWGERKTAAASALAAEVTGDLREAFAYANGDEDVPLLAAVGRPRAVCPQPLLERVARREGWPVLDLAVPAPAGVGAAVATAAAAVGMNAAFATGLAVRALPGARKAGTDLATTTAFDVALGMAGVRLRVVGAARLRAPRPAVYVFNHRSSLDPIVCGALLRRDFTATGKLEARRDPVGALAGVVLDAVYLDRDDPTRAYASLQRLVARLADGTSVMIAPEGTRVAGDEPGPYKRGAFDLAMRAGVPVVPIVLRGTAELMPPRAKAICSGTVDVAVLEPLPSAGWRRPDLEGVAADVRARTIAALEDWPTG